MQNISEMLNFVGQNSKEKIKAYLVTFTTATNCIINIRLYIWLTPEFALHFDGLKSH